MKLVYIATMNVQVLRVISNNRLCALGEDSRQPNLSLAGMTVSSSSQLTMTGARLKFTASYGGVQLVYVSKAYISLSLLLTYEAIIAELTRRPKVLSN